MCETFLFYHLCGHIHSKKVWKCSKEIERQLDSAKSDDDAPTHPSQPSFTGTGSCLDGNGPESFLKPTLCEKCEKAGVISDWLKNDPAMRFEIVKEWLQNKRLERAARVDVEANSEKAKIADRSDATESLASAEDGSSVETPSRKGSPSNIEIMDLDQFDSAELEQMSPVSLERPVKPEPARTAIGSEFGVHPDALEVMTPVLTEYLLEAESVEAEVEAVEQRIEKRAQDAEQDVRSTDDLKARTAAIRNKLESLIVESKQRNSARREGQSHDLATDRFE
ncbi:hypothetical protein PMZ80_004297 [Knufia obscura]|uniref:Uncharacterized protein n=2 Tax=Knufia TaxID=430999 RepID=A0AAN8I402_9EURO|nr:hypothetical protein PMZ80_004297 [Knufia obscura]KAK5949205.1 hypothetical protein OHC33_009746 [Knufia fluminis]